MTEKELKKLVEDKYGAYPDDMPWVVSKDRFFYEKDWDEYCRKTVELLNDNLSAKEFSDGMFLLNDFFGVSLPLDD